MGKRKREKTSVVRASSNENRGSLEIDGKDVSNLIGGYSIDHGHGEYPIVTVYYNCVEQMTFEGEAVVVHVCGKGG